jgi:hypothetical protein
MSPDELYASYNQKLGHGIISLMVRWISLSLSIGLFCCWAGPARADYTLILKNGGQFTVRSYREEGDLIKFHVPGGEMGIRKDQIQEIRKAGSKEQSNLTQPEPSTSAPTKQSAVEEKKAAPPVSEEKTGPTEREIAQQRLKEQKALEAKIKEVTDQLREVRQRYAAATTGVLGPEPDFFTSEEAFKAHQADLMSRLRDAQYRAQGLATGENAESPPMALNPPPPYTPKEAELSQMRSQMNQLDNERRQLVDEMRQINPELAELLKDSGD